MNIDLSNGIEWIINDDTAILYKVRCAFNDKSLYNKILEEVEWNQEIVYMAGKKYTTDRYTAICGDNNRVFKYSGKDMVAKGWSPTVYTLNNTISAVLNYQLNYCLLNYYKDGNTKLGFHADDEKSMVNGSPIISISFGSTRDFQIKPSSAEGKRKWEELGLNNSMNIELGNGDLLCMGGNMQKNYKHAVPIRKKVKDPRISLTFRRMI